MPVARVGTENSAPIDIHYEDHGSGKPIVLIHGYPQSGSSWEKQLPVLLDAGYRVITYDRRGFGSSSKPTVGYDYDTFAADLNALVEQLGLRETVLVGFSMGTGEVTRYLSRYGSARVTKAVLIGGSPPFLLKTDDNPEGLPRSIFDDFAHSIERDRYAFLKNFFDNFFNIDKLRGTRISDAAVDASFEVACRASSYASLACVSALLTDFREDLSKIDVPTLLLHGAEDRIVPIDITARRARGLIKNVTYQEIEGGPHAITWTHAADVNGALLDFLAHV